MGRLRAVLLLLLVPAFAGCVGQQTKPQQIAPSYDQLMKQAYARYEAKDLDGAKALYSKASSADPTRTDPWYRLAQINFDQQNYGHAIVDAQEVLQRNSADTNAKNILTIAGLRVAVEALGRLHEDADQTGPAQVEATKLAAKMRETLGQDVLIPPEAKKPSRRRSRARTVRAPEAQPAVSAPPKSANDNPFQALPGGGL